ncbi:MAG: hypothetical protein HKO53_13935, partial [Gemmatimonadetes bacterium]|nr:hypothetical protein [Gemmatimonadota bacterium]
MPSTVRSAAGALLLATLLTVDAPAAWLDSGWDQRLEITAQPTLIAGGATFSDFTLLLELNATNAAAAFAGAKADASDLVMTAGDGATQLGLEVVTYDPVAERAELWFKATTLSPTDNLFYLYFDNPDTTVARGQGDAWTTDHIGVFHFDQDPSLGVLEDSSPHDNFATTGTAASMWTSGDVIAGQIGQGWLMNGETHFIDADNVQSAEESFTISAWFALSNLNT